MIKSKFNDYAISFVMGIDDTIKQKLDNINAVYDIEDGKYYLTKIPKSRISEFEKIIKDNLKSGFWNEYISDTVVFIFKTPNNDILRFEWNNENENEILKLCNEYANFDKKSIKEMLLDEDFYKNNVKEY